MGKMNVSLITRFRFFHLNFSFECFVDQLSKYDIFERSISTECVCLDVGSLDQNVTDQFSHKIQSFEDECLCISHLLSSKEKLIYFVVSVAAGELVIPLVHNHRYIRYIYIYEKPGSNVDKKWIKDFGKIRGVWSINNKIAEIIREDIQSCKIYSFRWARHSNLLPDFWTQSSKKSSLNIMPLPKQKIADVIAKPNVVVLYYKDYRPFHLSHGSIQIHEYNDVEQCNTFLQGWCTQSSIFLIICIDSIDSYKSVYPCMKFDSVHLAYIFCNCSATEKFQRTSSDDNMKLSGMYTEFNDILMHLCNDICFYRELLFLIPKITMLRSDVSRIEELNEHEMDFIGFHLFIEIIPQISRIIYSSTKDNTSLSDELFRQVIVDSNFGQIMNTLFHRCGLIALLKATPLLNRITQQLNALALKEKEISPTAIYRAQIISKEHLDMLRNNINNLLTIHTFILFSHSFSSVVEICRRCIDNGVLVVLLEFEVTKDVTVAQIDVETFVCPLRSVFRLQSIDEMPDGIWHVQLNLMPHAIDYIKEQLPFKIDVQNTWLTFGNYLSALHRFEEAKVYYEYLLSNTSPEDPIRASIYNNMGLMYTAMDKQDEAIDFFKKSSETFVESASINAGEDHALSPMRRFVPDLEFHRVTLYGKIAEGYDRLRNYVEAVDYYQKALEFATDPATKLFYRTAIKETVEKNAKK